MQQMKSNLRSKIVKMVVLAILATVIVVLQSFAASIPVGPFTITLSLVPIVLGAVLYGPFAGAFLGAVFGCIVCAAVVSGADVGGNLMFQQLPFVTLFLCILKSTAAGFLAGLVCRALAKKNLYLGVVISAVLCPVVNTGILASGMLLFYQELVSGWALGAGYGNAFAYIILGMVGINFLVEMAINLVLIPAIVRIIQVITKQGLIKT
jgi:uncharacterized membrane protein